MSYEWRLAFLVILAAFCGALIVLILLSGRLMGEPGQKTGIERGRR